MTEKERSRRDAQRKASLQQLLYSREQTAELLGGVSIATIRRLESEGQLKAIRLSKSPTAQVFHRAADVHTLIEKAAEAAEA